MIPKMIPKMQAPSPALRSDFFHPGQRIAAAVSGGADSVALLRRLLEERSQLGVVLSVVHVHHGIRGREADADAAFVEELAGAFDLPFHLHRVDAPAAAAGNRETLEEAARNLRYGYFQELIKQGIAEAVVTAHTLDDQAETVLYKLLRGAWTEGLSGIHPLLPLEQGSILRPFLDTTRASIEEWLRELNQAWREDASNHDLAHTRNRIRHELLPLLCGFNPEIRRQLARMAEISAGEEHYWQGELTRLLPSLLLPGKPTRGGGRSTSTRPEQASVAMEIERLGRLHPAVSRRVLRAAARQLGARLNFDHTERLLALTRASNRSPQVELPGGVTAERTLRELRLTRSAPAPSAQEYRFSIPGEIDASQYGLTLRAELARGGEVCSATLRNWKAADRVQLPHSRSPKKVAEVLDRLHVGGADRKSWPVVEAAGKIVWMRGVEVDAPEFVFASRPLTNDP